MRPRPACACSFHPESSASPPPAAILLGALVAVLCLAACATGRSERRRLSRDIFPPQRTLGVIAKFADGIILVQGQLESTVAHSRPDTGEKPPLEGEGVQARQGAMGKERAHRDESADEDIEVLRARRAMLPRLALTLTFANAGPKTVEFKVVEVRSILGNFAPRPEQFTLAPGRQDALDAMLSNLPANLDEIDVTLTLKYGDGAETQVLKLRPAPPVS